MGKGKLRVAVDERLLNCDFTMLVMAQLKLPRPSQLRSPCFYEYLGHATGTRFTSPADRLDDSLVAVLEGGLFGVSTRAVRHTGP